MADEPSRLILEFTDADDPRGKDAWADNIESSFPRPIPIAGDIVYVTENVADLTLLLRVDYRQISYAEDFTHVQLFCRKIDEPWKTGINPNAAQR